MADLDEPLLVATGKKPAAMGWETQGVALVPAAEVVSYLNKDVDRTVASKAGLVAQPVS